MSLRGAMQLVDPDRYASLKATGKLPSPKGVALSIIRLLQREDFRVADLVQLVQSDPAIAGRLLYFANAAAFGRSRPIVSLQRAIVAHRADKTAHRAHAQIARPQRRQFGGNIEIFGLNGYRHR